MKIKNKTKAELIQMLEELQQENDSLKNGYEKDIAERNNWENTLKNINTEMELIFKNMINAFIIWESVFDENGNFVSFKFGKFNDAYSRIAGLKYEDVAGKDVFEVWPTTEQEWVQMYGKVAVTGKPSTFELYHDATKGWYRCNAYRPTDSPQQVCVIFEDVTLRRVSEEILKENQNKLKIQNENYIIINEKLNQKNKEYELLNNELLKAKEKAEESEMLMRKIANNLTDGMIYQVVTVDEYHRQFTFLSNTVKKFYGCTDEEVKSNADLIYSRIHPDDKQKIIDEELIAIRNMTMLKTEVRVLNPDGSLRWSYIVSSPRLYKGLIYWDGIEIDITERKLNEQELIKAKEKAQYNEMRLKEAQELAKIGNWELDIVNNSLTWSDEIFRIFGCEPQEFGATYEAFLDLIHPEDREKVNNAYLKHIKTKEPYNIIHRILLKNAEVKYVNERCKSEYDDDDNPLLSLGTVADITESILVQKELQRAKEEAEKNELKYKLVYHNTPVMMQSSDIQGNLISVNDYWLQIMGYELQEVIGTPTVNYLTQESRDYYHTIIPQLIKDGSINNVEAQVVKKDGTIIDLFISSKILYDTNGIPIQTLTNLIDITEKKLIETEIFKEKERAEESEKRFKALHNASFGGIAIHDKGYIIDCNKGLSEISGFTFEELIGMDGLLLIAPSHRAMVMNNIVGGYEKPYEAMGIRKNGQEYPIRLEGKNIPYKGKQVRVVEFRDITEQKNAEIEIIKAKERAEESDRLKSAFLANMSHEIRTPMNGILGFATLLAEQDLSGEQQLEYIRIIENSGKRMLNIINDIVNISKIESGQMTVSLSGFNINEQIEEIYSFFKPDASKKGITLFFKASLPDSEATIITDKEKMVSVLTNLVKNSLKFTNTGYIEFGYVKKDNFLEFFVKDTGTGIKREQKEIIFERFRQGSESLTRNYEGAGLGLSISKAFIEMLGGSIWVESKEGKGSVFYFTLPYITEEIEKNNKEISSQKKNDEFRLSNLKILIAEDDSTTEKLMKVIVKKYCNEVLIARDGDEAVQLCKDNPDIDLILMDIKMPKMNGYEAIKLIRQFNTKVVIFALTAYALSGDRERAIETGCNDYLPKPIIRDEFNEMIKRHFKK